MDVESQQTITASIAQLKAAGDELVDRFAVAMNTALAQAQAALSKTLADTLQGVDGAAAGQISSVFIQATALLNNLDGWSLNISVQLSKLKGAV